MEVDGDEFDDHIEKRNEYEEEPQVLEVNPREALVMFDKLTNLLGIDEEDRAALDKISDKRWRS